MKINKNLPERKHNGVLQIPLSEKSKKKNQKEITKEVLPTSCDKHGYFITRISLVDYNCFCQLE